MAGIAAKANINTATHDFFTLLLLIETTTVEPLKKRLAHTKVPDTKLP
jgi:hypothetical protein